MVKNRPLEVFILGVFNTFYNQPLSGYELIKIAKEWRFTHYIEASSNASFYYTLKKFKKKGFIEEVGSEQDENRPEKTIYKLLPKGEQEFFKQMSHYLHESEEFYFNIDATTPFILLYGAEKGKEALIEALEKQIQKRSEMFKRIKEGKNYVKSHDLFDLNPFTILALEHYKFHNEAEIKWLEHFKKMVEGVDFEKNLGEIIQRKLSGRKQN
jgi:DNA-binding PadR family transcriptional regulator